MPIFTALVAAAIAAYFVWLSATQNHSDNDPDANFGTGCAFGILIGVAWTALLIWLYSLVAP